MTSALPDYDDLPKRAGLRAAWGVWGEGNDIFGCLNLLTPERVAAASGLVRRGAVFALNWSMGLPDPPLFGRGKFEHEVTGAGTGHDDVLHGWNTQSSSQWDGFRHIRNHAAQASEPGTGHFGGVPDEEHGIHHWAQRGIAGRAVLADIARWREANGTAASIRRIRRHRSGRDHRVSRRSGRRARRGRHPARAHRMGRVVPTSTERRPHPPRRRRPAQGARVRVRATTWHGRCGTCTSRRSAVTTPASRSGRRRC